MSSRRDSDPSVHRHRLGRALRDARERAGLTQREAYTAMDWSVSKLLRIEAGSGTITTNDLRALLGLYALDGEPVHQYTEMARAARGVSRWSVYRDVAGVEHQAFLGYEASATIIRNFEPLLVPDLLQTEDYARAAVEVFEAETPERIEPLVDLRIERQEVLTASPTPQLHFVMDEAVIRRVVGSAGVTRHQLNQLLELGHRPNVTVRIVPFSVGVHATLRSPYVLFEFDREYENTLYVGGPFGDYVTRENSHGHRDRSGTPRPEVFLAEFWKLEHLTNGPESRTLIEEALRRLG
jgi:transcriptional regulator with XRE-family HTH domain